MYAKFFLVLVSLLVLLISSLVQTTGALNASGVKKQCNDNLLPVSTRSRLIHEASSCED